MAKNIDVDDLISQKEAAQIRGITLQGIASLVKRAKLKTIVIGGKTFLSRKEVQGYKPGIGGRPRKKSVQKTRKRTKQSKLSGAS